MRAQAFVELSIGVARQHFDAHACNVPLDQMPCNLVQQCAAHAAPLMPGQHHDLPDLAGKIGIAVAQSAPRVADHTAVEFRNIEAIIRR